MPRTHKTVPRLYVDMPLTKGGEFVLGRDQSSYLINVMRKRVGDELIIFNGRDGAWLARIHTAGKREVILSLVEQTSPQTPPSDLWYGFAPLKAARLDYMIQKATEMGVGTLQPVITQHTQVNRLKLERMRANAVEAAEQCEVLSIPDVLPEVKLTQLIADWPKSQPNRMLILADESEASASPAITLEAVRGKPVGLLIGPEGGFSAEERTLLHEKDFIIPVSLGPRILRADTAAVAALAVIQSTIGDWR